MCVLCLTLCNFMAQMVKNLPAMQETQIQCLGWENPPEKGMITHSSILACRISWTEEPGRLQSMGSQRVGNDWVTFTFRRFRLLMVPLQSDASHLSVFRQGDKDNMEWISMPTLEIYKGKTSTPNIILFVFFVVVVVQLLSHVQLFVNPWTTACQVSLSFIISKIVQTQVHWVEDATKPSHPLLSHSPPALNLSQHQGLFQLVGSLYQVAKWFSAN